MPVDEDILAFEVAVHDRGLLSMKVFDSAKDVERPTADDLEFDGFGAFQIIFERTRSHLLGNEVNSFDAIAFVARQ